MTLRKGEADSSIAHDVEQDVETIGRLKVVETALEALSEATGLRVALVARAASDLWTACAVRDQAEFGIKPGDRLDLATTY